MARKYPPSRQVTFGSFGALVNLHALDNGGWSRLADRPEDPRQVQLRHSETTVAFAQTAESRFNQPAVGLARPTSGVVVAEYGSPYGPRPSTGALVLFDPARLTPDAQAQADALLAAHGPVVAARVDLAGLGWGRCDGQLSSFVATSSVLGATTMWGASHHTPASDELHSSKGLFR